ncbi:hypothetical protein ACNKHO_03300 [Shigella flexneri]
MSTSAFHQIAQAAGQVQRTDLALALVALWLGRLTGRLDYAARVSVYAPHRVCRARPRPARCSTSCRWR